MLIVDLGSLKVSSDPTQERITNTKVCLGIIDVFKFFTVLVCLFVFLRSCSLVVYFEW